ncbi:hypothetical protein LXA43DRAFT_171917 [Ganoderma leucocontextum]|nr:hypothetical protein LXA43DRAFT_171917 [Ganoderma leucocontextum]
MAAVAAMDAPNRRQKLENKECQTLSTVTRSALVIHRSVFWSALSAAGSFSRRTIFSHSICLDCWTNVPGRCASRTIATSTQSYKQSYRTIVFTNCMQHDTRYLEPQSGVEKTTTRHEQSITRQTNRRCVQQTPTATTSRTCVHLCDGPYQSQCHLRASHRPVINNPGRVQGARLRTRDARRSANVVAGLNTARSGDLIRLRGWQGACGISISTPSPRDEPNPDTR